VKAASVARANRVKAVAKIVDRAKTAAIVAPAKLPVKVASAASARVNRVKAAAKTVDRVAS
jgi:hypothetical protein